MTVPDKSRRTKGQEIAASVVASFVGGALGLAVGSVFGAPGLWLVLGAIVGELIVLTVIVKDRE
jgi:hypothetical protein